MIDFLRWDNQADADTSLAAVEAVYGCPYSNGDYIMDDWAIVTKSESANEWGFYKPQVIHGVLEVNLTDALELGYTETAIIPIDWIL